MISFNVKISKTVQDRAVWRTNRKSYVIYRTAPFSMTYWTTPTPSFKVTSVSFRMTLSDLAQYSLTRGLSATAELLVHNRWARSLPIMAWIRFCKRLLTPHAHLRRQTNTMISLAKQTLARLVKTPWNQIYNIYLQQIHVLAVLATERWITRSQFTTKSYHNIHNVSNQCNN